MFARAIGMQSTGRVAYSSDESTEVKIDSLYLDGASGKVVANIDHRMLSPVSYTHLTLPTTMWV